MNVFDKLCLFPLFNRGFAGFHAAPASEFFCIFVLKHLSNQGKTAVNSDMHSNAFLTTKRVCKQCTYHLYQTEYVAKRKYLLSIQM